MRSLRLKDIKNRKHFLKFEKLKLFRKFIFITLINKLKAKQQNPILLKKSLYLLINGSYSFLKLTSKTALLRRCLITNRNRSNLRSFNLSRIVMRDFMQFGILPGYKKAAW